MIKYILITLFLTLAVGVLFSQQMRFIEHQNGSYGVLDTFPSNAVADDFGPRWGPQGSRSVGDNWHQGVDFNKTAGAGAAQINDLFCSPLDGQFANVNLMIRTNGRIRSQVVNHGAYFLKYLHVFNNSNTVPASFNGGDLFLNSMLAPFDDEWGMVIVTSIDTFYLGQVNGRMLWGSDTVMVSNNVSQYDPIGPIGTSGGYPAHLHMEAVLAPNNGGDNHSYSPLQYLAYDEPVYDVSVRNPTGSNIQIDYSGNTNSKFAVKVAIQGETNGTNRYGSIMDVNRVLVSESAHNINQFQQIQGENELGIISLGAFTGESRINITPFRGYQGRDFYRPIADWQRTGVLANAYNGNSAPTRNAPNPWDEYFFTDFPIRIQANDIRSDGVLSLADAPDDARFADGWRELKVEVISEKNDTTDHLFDFNIDNFKPYIKSLKATINGTLVYDFKWETVNGRLVPVGGIPTNLAQFDAFALAQGMLVTVETSEQLHDLELNLARQLGDCDPQNASAPTIANSIATVSANRREWTFQFGDLRACPPETGAGMLDPAGMDWRFLFDGHDFGPSGNVGSELLSFHKIYDAVADGNGNNNVQVALDHRISTTAPEWSTTGHPDLISGTDETHYFRFSCGGKVLNPTDETADLLAKKDEKNLGFICCDDIEVLINAPRIKPPSSCDSADGRFSHRGFSARPSIPFGQGQYSFHLEYNGDIISPDNFGNFSGLSSGEYCVVATNPSGCLGTKCFMLRHESAPEEIVETIIPACDENSPSGWIEVFVYFPFDADYTYDFQWSNGTEQLNSPYSIVSGLLPGDYQVTITSTVDPECEIIREYMVPVADITTPPLTLSVELTHPCPGDDNGRIKVLTEGDDGPFEIFWEDGQDYGFGRAGFTAGTYSFSVSGRCHTVTETVVLKPLVAEASVQGGCGSGDISVTARDGNSPYTFMWSDGTQETSTSGSTLQSIPSGRYSVTVVDRNGCRQAVTDLVLNNQEVELTNSSASCTGLLSGSFDIVINNPESVLPLIRVNGNAVGGGGQAENIVLTLDGLEGDETYNVSVDFGNGCILEEELELAEDLLELSLVSTEDDVCSFVELCDGEVVGDGTPTSFSAITYHHLDALGDAGTPFGKCRARGSCDGVEGFVREKNTGIVTMTVAEYHGLIDNLLAAGVISPGQVANTDFGGGLNLSQFGNIPDINEGRNCDRLWVCPFSLRANPWPNPFSFINNDGIQVGRDDFGCSIVFCPGLNRTINPCRPDQTNGILNDFGVDPTTVIPPDPPADCDITTKSVFKLMTWHDQMVDHRDDNGNFSELSISYTGSELFVFIRDLLSLPDGDDRKKRATCADVTYCKEDFSIIDDSDIDFVNCQGYQLTGQTGGVICLDPSNPGNVVADITCSWIQGCLTTPVGNTGLIRIQCATPNEFFVEDFDPVFDPVAFNSLGSSGGDVGVSVVDQQTEDTWHQRLSYIEYEGVLYPKPVVQSRTQENVYVNFDPRAKLDDIYELGSIEYIHIDYDNFDQYYLIKSSNSKYQFVIEKRNESPVLIPFESEGRLNVDVTFTDGKFVVSTVATGKLSIDEQSVSNVSSKTILTQTIIDKQGMVSQSKNISFPNMSQHELKRVVDVSKNPKLLRFKNDTPLSFTEGAQVMSGANSTYLYDFFSGESQKLTLSNLEDLTVVSSFSNNGNVKLILKDVDGLESNKLYVNDYSQNTPVTKVLTVVSGTITNESVTEVSEKFSVLSLTFDGRVKYDGREFRSEGGKDILLLKIDATNGLLGYKQYASEDDEEIVQVEYKNDLLLLAGNYSGDTYERHIGAHNFLQTTVTMENGFVSLPMVRPFLSYMSISDFEKISGREYGSKQKADINDDLLSVYPNPATDQIIVTINTQGEVIKPNVIDATGRSVPVTVESISRSMEGVTYAIGLAGMRDGVYVFAVLVNGSYESVKFIIKK